MNRADILDRIKKLLALSASPHAGEAQQALARAQALMAEHGLDVADVEPAAAGGRRYRDDELAAEMIAGPWFARPVHAVYVAGVVYASFPVRVSFHTEGIRQTLWAFGDPGAVAAAGHAWKFVEAQLLGCWERRVAGGAVAHDDLVAYSLGFCEGMTRTVTESRASLPAVVQNAIAVVRAKGDAAFERKYGEKPTRKVGRTQLRGSPEALALGMLDGSTARLRRPVGTDAGRPEIEGRE